MKKILHNVFHYLKKDSLNRRLGEVDRQVAYKGYEEIRNALVFWNVHADQEKWLQQIVNDFPGVKIDKLCFVPEGSKVAVSDEWVILKNSDLGFGGKIQNTRLQSLMQQRYDIFIDLTENVSALAKYVQMHIPAAFVVGMKKEGGVADIVVEDVNGPIQFVDELKKILSGINRY